MDPIVNAALAARTRADVDNLENLLRKALGGEHIRFLGEKRANWSQVSSSAEPTTVIFERNTNMFDANIELEAELTGMRTCPTPAGAVQALFGVPRSGLDDMPEADRRALAERSVLMLLDSDDPEDHPTIAFRDRGIGIVPADVPGTILSLAETNKLDKPYTHGVFGKGGSSACPFSDATIVVTRKDPRLLDDPVGDRITVAIVREGDTDDSTLPLFRYLVAETDRLPYSVPATAHPEFEPGTYVAHVNYQAGRMGRQRWDNEESVYALAETILFKPTLPYQLLDARSGKANKRPEGRGASVVYGLEHRIDAYKSETKELLDRSAWQRIPVPGVGDVRLRWWLFPERDTRRQRVAKGFVTLFITNGQIHHAWDEQRLNSQVKNFSRVAQRILVEVDCDGLSIKMRARIFDSFRNQTRRGAESRALEEAVAYALENDADLQRHQTNFIRQALQDSSGTVTAAFRKRLNRWLKAKVPGLAPSGSNNPGPRPPKGKSPEDLHPEPTMMTGPQRVTLLLGGRASAYMELNAVDGFVPERGEITLEGPEPLPLVGVGDLRKGRLHLTLTATAELTEKPIDAVVALSWMRSNGGLGRIEWPLTIDVVGDIKPKPTGHSKGEKKPTNDGEVAFVWVPGRKMEWENEVVGTFEELTGDQLSAYGGEYAALAGDPNKVPTIILNQDFADWATYLKSVITRGATDAMKDRRREKYGLAVGVTVANLVERERKLETKMDDWQARQNGTDAPPAAMTAEQLNRAMAEAARGVVALMPDFDELLGDYETK